MLGDIDGEPVMTKVNVFVRDSRDVTETDVVTEPDRERREDTETVWEREIVGESLGVLDKQPVVEARFVHVCVPDARPEALAIVPEAD